MEGKQGKRPSLWEDPLQIS